MWRSCHALAINQNRRLSTPIRAGQGKTASPNSGGLKETMRSSKSRSRSKSNRNRSSVGNVVNRVFDSSGPEGKVRGTPQQIIDKYTQLTRDAQLSNDRVAAENFQQHAEHYTRMLAEALREAEMRREQQEAQQQQNRDRQQRGGRDDNRGGNAGGNAGGAAGGNAPAQQPVGEDTPQPDIAEPAASTPDVIDVVQVSDDNGLVDTPESKPRKPRAKPRKRAPADQSAEKKAEGEAPSNDDAVASDTPETA